MSGRSSRKGVKEAKVNVKPLSVNQCWQGRRYKTKQYKQFEKDVMKALPDNLDVSGRVTLMVYFRFGHSNKSFDWDNGIKPFQDILQKAYGFDDKQVYAAIVEKEIVPKGKEYIFFRIEKISPVERLRELIKELFP